MTVFWDVLWSLVENCQHFTEAHCLYHQGDDVIASIIKVMMMEAVPLTCRQISNILHGGCNNPEDSYLIHPAHTQSVYWLS
jgi:hypothetical protein